MTFTFICLLVGAAMTSRIIIFFERKDTILFYVMAAQPTSSTGALSTPTSSPTFESRVLKQFICGSVGGLLLVGTSHPWDTIKTRVQAGEFRNVREAFRVTVLGSGVTPGRRIATLYRGATLPISLQGFYTASLFALNQSMQILVSPQGHRWDAPLPLDRVILAAIIVAPIHTLLMTPMDNIKTRLQAIYRLSQYKGPLQCVRKVILEEGNIGSGGIKALWSGYLAFAAVRTVGFGPYFATFELTKSFLTQPNVANGQRQLLAIDSSLVPLIGGSCAGVAYWVPAYPFDIIKTTVQLSRAPMWEGHARRNIVTAAGHQNAPMSYTEAISFVLTNGTRSQKYSPIHLYRGFGAAIARAVPANAALWFGVKETDKFLTKNGLC